MTCNDLANHATGYLIDSSLTLAVDGVCCISAPLSVLSMPFLEGRFGNKESEIQYNKYFTKNWPHCYDQNHGLFQSQLITLSELHYI